MSQAPTPLNLPLATNTYDKGNEAQTRAALVKADTENVKLGRDYELARGERIILVSSGGVRWALSVSDAGALTTVAA